MSPRKVTGPVIDGGMEDTGVSSTPVRGGSDVPVTKVSQLSPASRSVIEANAKSQGMTPQEYLESRGGVYGSGYYGDTPSWYRPTDAEYAELMKTGGVKAVNKFLVQKNIDKYLADNPGKSLQDAQAALLRQGYNAADLGLTDDQARKIGGSFLGSGAGMAGASGAAGAGISASEKSAQENAIEVLKRTFASYGLESLADRITDLVRKGYRNDTISLMLQDSPEYKQRFIANEARKKAGLPVLSPAEYLATEVSYRRAMQMAGLPAGYYDSNEDYAKLIANDVSPTELNARLDAAKGAIANADPLYVDQLKKYYNMTTGQLIAYALDPQTALPILERQAAAVGLGVAAAQQGIAADAKTAEYYAGLGIGEQQARAGFAGIAKTLPTYEKLGEIYGKMPQDSTKALMAATFGGEGQAAEQQRIEELARREKSTFSGSSGAAATAFGTSQTAGLL